MIHIQTSWLIPEDQIIDINAGLIDDKILRVNPFTKIRLLHAFVGTDEALKEAKKVLHEHIDALSKKYFK